MAWEWPASPTCPPSGLGSTRCSDFLQRNRHSNRVSASRGLRFRETGFRGQRKMRRNDVPTVTMPSLRTNRRTDPANSGLFVLFQEISGSIRLRGGGCRPDRTGLDVKFPDIPGLRDDPKIVGRDDTKVVGDSVAKAVPFFGNSSPEEAQDCRSELGEGFIASIIGDMFVHYAPASFDRIKMRTIGRDEVQPDPASRLPQPLTHQNRVVVGGVVKKDVDPFLSRIGGF